MIRKFVSCMLAVLILSGCTHRSRGLGEISSSISEVNYSTISINQNSALPPYGMKVFAPAVFLDLVVMSRKNDPEYQLMDIENAIQTISDQVSQNDAISFEFVSARQLHGADSYMDRSNFNYAPLSTSSVTIRLSTRLETGEVSFLNVVHRLNNFINSLKLPDSIYLSIQSIEADLGDLEPYRQAIITRVYDELEASKRTRDQSSINYEITGLYDPLKVIPLSDVEYFVYLEPVVKVIDS